MALDSYASLQASIITYAMREGDEEFAAAVPTFITLCEKFIGRELRVWAMEKTATLTLDDEGMVDLPADYIEFRTLSGIPVYGDLELITPAQAVNTYGNNPGGVTRAVSIVGNRLATYPSSGTVTLTYYGMLDPLSDANPSNWLLDRFPDVYLYGSLAQAEPFMMNDPRTATWGSLFQASLDGVKKQDVQSRFSRSQSRIRGVTP